MANMNFGVNIIPKTNNTYSLGNSDYKWNIFANQINGTNVSSFLTSHQDISGKLNINQDAVNSGKILTINSSGTIEPTYSATHIYTGTGTTGQAGSSSKAYIPSVWTFDIGRTPVAGDIITITVPAAGISAGVWISVDNGTNYYPIAVNNKTRLTTQYAIDNQITLIYQENMVTTTYGTDITGAPKGSSAADITSDRWVVLNYYDANTTYSNASLGQGYGTCATAAATAAKEVTLSSYALTTGGIVAVKFTYDVPANATLNINAKGAKAIYYKGAKITAGVLKAGDIGVFIYSSYYYLIGIDKAIDRLLPTVSSTDNGKVLRVVSGAWSAVELPSASGVSF